ncbi:unnamed protein product [Arctogadus glacialis]
MEDRDPSAAEDIRTPGNSARALPEKVEHPGTRPERCRRKSNIRTRKQKKMSSCLRITFLQGWRTRLMNDGTWAPTTAIGGHWHGP